ncbi:MAG: hypothetical protein AB7T49_04440 [Oligoflexales bacterium]
MKLLPLVILAALQLALFEPVHSKLTATSKVSDDKKTLILEFKIEPNKGIQITKDGPWKLTLTQPAALGLKDTNGTFESKDFDNKIPGFQVSATPAIGSKGSTEYTVNSFVCTDDKKRCFPEIHKGKLDWSRP